MAASHAEFIVIGGGVMGTACALSLARRGKEVLLLERFSIPNEHGSSHGLSRILRFAYFEHPDYVRMVTESHAMWRALERESGEALMLKCGGLDIGPATGELVSGSRRSCETMNLEHEILDGADIARRFPFTNTDAVQAVYQPDACILSPERCVRAQATQAMACGCSVHEHERVQTIASRGSGVDVHTDRDRYRARQVIVTAGGWAGALLSELGLPLTVRRKVLAFFEPAAPALFDPTRFPVFIFQVGGFYYYGFPLYDSTGVKIGDHCGGDAVDPDRVDRNIRPDEEAHLRSFLEAHLPAAGGRCQDFQTCLYTLTPDDDFIIDHHPMQERVVLAAGFSGHGFKFGPLVGEILADLAIDGVTAHPIDRFRLSRFRNGPSTA